MTTLFTREEKPLARATSGKQVLLYAFAAILWLGIAIGNFRGGNHKDRAWMQAITAALSFFTMAMHLSQWLKQRRAS